MPSKFQVGDRVAVYSSESRWIGQIEAFGADDENMLRVSKRRRDGPIFYYRVNVKCCRRLVKKPRKRIWISPKFLEDVGKGSSAYICADQKPNEIFFDGWIQFVEVKNA